MPSINLAPGTQYMIVARKRRMRLYVIAASIVLLFLIGGFGLLMYVQSLQNKSDAVKAEIQATDRKIQALQEEALRIAAFEKRLVDISKLLDTHIGWENVFAELERLVPPETVFTSFNASSDDSTIVVKGRTANLDQIALTLASLTAGENHPSLFSTGTVRAIQQLREEATPEREAIVQYEFEMMLEFDTSSLRKGAL